MVTKLVCIRLRDTVWLQGKDPGNETSFDDVREYSASGARVTPEVGRPGKGCFPEEIVSEPLSHEQVRVRGPRHGMCGDRAA